MSTCLCISEDAEAAHQQIVTGPGESTWFVNESHLGVSIWQCGICGQRFLHVFTELIDWEDGDDSQAFIYCPISEAEAAKLNAETERIDGRYLTKLGIERRILWRNWPRGGGSSIFYTEGPLIILPHD